jgi:hypothetical protein
MKRCPTCNKTFTDANLSFCIDDGTPLVTIADDETTVVSPSGSQTNEPPAYKPRDWQTLPYQPPGFTGPTNGTKKSKTWPWIAGIIAVVVIAFVGLGIAAALIIPQLVRTGTNRNSNANVSRAESSTPNLNSNVPTPQPTLQSNDQNTNSAADENLANEPPTDQNKVLADLTQVEHDWTAANIDADKQKLDRILADDYVGILEDGTNQGKADYIATVERDDSIERWDFEDLKVSLKGNRATLTGLIRYYLRNGEAAFLFIDKFVWRDGRWQAVSSQIRRVQ